MSLNFKLQTEGDFYRNSSGRRTDKADRQVDTNRQTDLLAQKSRQTGYRTQAGRQVGTKRQIDRFGVIGR